MSRESERYNKMYAEKKDTFGEGKPVAVVENILKYKTEGSAFEVGAGEGRNALFLAEKGFTVTAVDVSDVGIKKIDTRAAEKGLSIQTEVQDIRNFNFDKNFDVLVSTFVFHHLPREEALVFIKTMQEHTNSDGINAISTFTKNGDFYRGIPDNVNFYPDENELKNLYTGWDILEYSEIDGKVNEKRDDGTPKTNVTAHLLARKNLLVPENS